MSVETQTSTFLCPRVENIFPPKTDKIYLGRAVEIVDINDDRVKNQVFDGMIPVQYKATKTIDIVYEGKLEEPAEEPKTAIAAKPTNRPNRPVRPRRMFHS